MRRTLLLNATYQPIGAISWQKAVALWYTDKVEVVEEYADFAIQSAGGFVMQCPAVVRLVKVVKQLFKRGVKFSRLNVFGRDRFTCQYCGDQPGIETLTYDHVLPRSRGGKTSWTNIVTACYDCNSKKADKTPEEAKMKLKRAPHKPSIRPENSFRFGFPDTPDEWRSYLFWNTELEQD